MYVDDGFDIGLMAMLYLVLFAFAFFWWWFTTKSRNKLLEVSSSMAIIGVVLTVASAAGIIINWVGPLTVGEILLIVGLIMAAVGAAGGLLLTKKEAQ